MTSALSPYYGAAAARAAIGVAILKSEIRNLLFVFIRVHSWLFQICVNLWKSVVLFTDSRGQLRFETQTPNSDSK
jgi:hypothetical protein